MAGFPSSENIIILIGRGNCAPTKDKVIMSVNKSLNYLKSQQSIIVLPFSDSVTTSSKYLKGAGGISGDGFAMPYPGMILKIQVYDGSTLHQASGQIEFSADDRISVYANYTGSDFTVYVRKNGVNTIVLVTGVPASVNLLVSVTCKLTES